MQESRKNHKSFYTFLKKTSFCQNTGYQINLSIYIKALFYTPFLNICAGCHLMLLCKRTSWTMGKNNQSAFVFWIFDVLEISKD
jgi:hypothetical protein